MSNWDKFKETKLPLREAFYRKLNMAGVREEDYEQALRVWKMFGLKNLFKELWIGPSSLLYSSWISLESLLKEN